MGTSDGMVDIWGPRLDWTNFAPDFQSLQKNVEYVEKEDEFVVQNVQKGINSAFYKSGRYSATKEKGVHHFHYLLSKFLNS